MILIQSAREMQSLGLQSRRKCSRIGFVPTMGFLHEGHLSLVRLAMKTSDFVVVSSFVNPAQFGPNEDLDKYPRNHERDDSLCEKAGVSVVFRPDSSEIYANDHSVYVDELKLSSGLCGRFRPGHFRGVMTVVAKLFNIVQPHVAVFGRKDAQQARIIEQMVRDLNFPVEIVIGPIIREPDGLAMSSRNAYLSTGERKRACGIYRALCAGELLAREGVTDLAIITQKIRKIVEEDTQPDTIEYIEAVDYETFEPVDFIERSTLIAIAVKIGRTRLIDNALISL